MKSPKLLAKIQRSGQTESLHFGYICLRDNNGISYFGDPDFTCFTRSCIKPIQAKIAKEILGEDLSDEFLALACASHMAEEFQIETLEKFKKKFKLKTELLKCGSISQSRGDLQDPLKHNCSGKHLSILASIKKANWSLEDYLSAQHPFNLRVLEEIKKLSQNSNIALGQDDCGLPSYYMSLADMSLVFFNLIHDNSYSEIIETMNRFPFLIGGTRQIDSILMNKYPNQFMAKGGAEGLIAITKSDTKESLIIKIADGSNRAKSSIVNQVLKDLDWISEDLIEAKLLKGSSGQVVGSIETIKVALDKN